MASRTELQDEFAGAFLDPNDDMFCEDIIYTAQGASPKTIRGHVYREGLRMSGARNSASSRSQEAVYVREIQISRNATDGIAVVTTQADSVQMANNEGEPFRTFRVAAIAKQDPACWRLGLSI